MNEKENLEEKQLQELQEIHQIQEKDKNKKSIFKSKIFYLVILIILIVGVVGNFLYLDKNNQQEEYQIVDTLPEEFTSPVEETPQNINIGDNAKDYNKSFSPSQGFADLVEYVGPSVVNISVVKVVKNNEIEQALRGLDPNLQELFRDSLPQNIPQEQQMSSIGSGFIVRSDGFVVTNHHVVASSTKITVTLKDGRKFDGTLYASDPVTDIAVIKIAAQDLPTVKFGNSQQVRAGDWVITIGNPFGLSNTVSSGIISAIGRNIEIGLYNDFIQTDAAINRGNSGGPMINTKGEVIGMNTAIFSTTGGGSIGIGFAVPSNTMMKVITDLISKKSVSRGWLGVQIQGIDENIKESLGLTSAEGALVSTVVPGSPAEKAGLKAGDVILQVNEDKIINNRILPLIIGNLTPNTTVDVKIFSNKQEKNIKITLGNVPNNQEQTQEENINPLNKTEGVKSETFEDLGIQVAEINESLKQFFKLPQDAIGLVVVGIKANSIAHQKGFQPSLRIISLDQKEVKTLEEFKQILKDNDTNVFLFRVMNNQNNTFFVSISKKEIEQGNIIR